MLTFKFLSEVGGIGIGFVACSFLEYAYHRWIAHPIDARYHAAHHAGQIDKSRYPAWCFVAAMPLVVALLPGGVWRGLLIGSFLEICLFIGINALYHSSLTIPLRTYTNLKRRHEEHHASPQCNYGVTTAVWDKLFKTAGSASVRRQQQRQAEQSERQLDEMLTGIRPLTDSRKADR